VYVLDWGIARLDGDLTHSVAAEPEAAPGETEAGAVLGTLGYMAPEQLRGEVVGPPADVYALGCILFEILAREPLHRQRGLDDTATDRSPARRRPERGIAPELDLACVAALAGEPAERPTARALADRVQRYLDGDRDLELRRTLAAEEVAAARAALAAGDRAGAIQASGRALALDAGSKDAAALVSSLLLEAPREVPPALQEHLDRLDHHYERRQYRISGNYYLAFLPFLPVLIWQGVTSWPIIAAVFACSLAYIVLSRIESRSASRPRVLPGLLLAIALALPLARMFSPFVILPGLLCIMMASWASAPILMDRPLHLSAALSVALLVPIVLELTGLISPTWSVEEHAISIRSAALDLGGTPTTVLLIAGNLVTIVVCGLLVRQLARERREAQRKIESQAWHLRMLLPS